MSVFTTEVRYICEQYAGLTKSEGYSKIEDILEKSRKFVFDFNYPIFDEKYRPVLEKAILRFYYTREIGFETVGLWKLHLSAKMMGIMPYYNKLYESEKLDFNPFYDTDLTTHTNRDKSGENNLDGSIKENGKNNTDSSSTENNDSTNKFWDTPQDDLNGFKDGNYLTDLRNIKENNGATGNVDTTYSNNRTTDNTTTYTDTDEYWETVVGKKGGASYSQLLQEYRQTFLRIDMMIIDELKDLFMNLWDVAT